MNRRPDTVWVQHQHGANTQMIPIAQHSSTMIAPPTAVTCTHMHNITPQNVTLGCQITASTRSHHSSVPAGLLYCGASVMVNTSIPLKRSDSVPMHVLCMCCQYHRQTTTDSPRTTPTTPRPPQQFQLHQHPRSTTLCCRFTYKFRSIRSTTY